MTPWILKMITYQNRRHDRNLADFLVSLHDTLDPSLENIVMARRTHMWQVLMDLPAEIVSGTSSSYQGFTSLRFSGGVGVMLFF